MTLRSGFGKYGVAAGGSVALISLAFIVKGAGGAGGTQFPPMANGGTGGLSSATITLAAGTELIVKVGGRGGGTSPEGSRMSDSPAESTSPGGRNGGGTGEYYGGGGGGYSGIFIGSATHANALLIAGGGAGGAQGPGTFGAGGGPVGAPGGGSGNDGSGGTQSAGGTNPARSPSNGAALVGGSSSAPQAPGTGSTGSGGGAGYYGGAGGSYNPGYGNGGGGSSFVAVNGSTINGVEVTVASSSLGQGGGGAGGNSAAGTNGTVTINGTPYADNAPFTVA
jgi:hypothetical protein